MGGLRERRAARVRGRGLVELEAVDGGHGGLGVFTGPSGGFALGFAPGAFVIGLLVDLWPGRFAVGRAFVGALVGGVAVIYALGIPWQAHVTGLPIGVVLTKSWVFLPGDLAKAVIAAIVAGAVVRAYPIRNGVTR